MAWACLHPLTLCEVHPQTFSIQWKEEMQAVVCVKNGEASTPLSHPDCPISLQTLPRPKPMPNHVRVQVHSVSLNFPDALQIRGTYQNKLSPPFVPGSEASGTVVESTSSSFKAGDRVVAVVEQGALAEELLAHESVVFKVPDAVSLDVAACIPIAYGTTELALRHRARIKPGSTLLVLGAAGGVGVAACQIGALVGARVVAVCSGQEKASFLKKDIGVKDIIDLTSLPPGSSLSKEVRKICSKGVDIVFDPVGGDLFSEALKSVAWGAQYLVIGFAAGGIPNVPANHLLVKNTTLHGIFWGSYLLNDPKTLKEGISFLLQCIQDGRLDPKISKVFPMERIDQAFQMIKERRVMGKVVVRVRPDSKL